MTTTLKKRLQAVVALLVAVMILIGIMPTSIWQGIKVDADETKTFTIYFDKNYKKGDSGNNAGWSDANRIGIHIWGNISSEVRAYMEEMENGEYRYVYTGTKIPGKVQFMKDSNTTDTNTHITKVVDFSDNGIYGVWESNTSIRTGINVRRYGTKTEEDNSGDDNVDDGEGGGMDLENAFPVTATFYDYHDDYTYDSAVFAGNTNRGTSHRPFAAFNTLVSESNYGKTTTPMYLGQFWPEWRSDVGETGSVQAGKYGDNDVFSYNTSEHNGSSHANLSNFKWYANLAFRYSGSTPSGERYHAVAQGLVARDLDNGGNLMANGERVPYFNKDFLDYKKNDSNTIGSYGNAELEFKNRSITSKYPSESSTNRNTFYTSNYYVFSSYNPENPAFGDQLYQPGNIPDFYDVFTITKGANGATWNSNIVHSEGVTTGSDTVKDADGKAGFMPFNNPGTGNAGNDMNFGFGMKMKLNFKVTNDGTVGGSGDNDDTPMVFRFAGDDDLWVFIDGKLVLDMGGAHEKAVGEINFKTLQTYIGYVADGKDLVNSNVSSKLETFSFDRTKSHTMTIFYMERGMINSNLYIQYNFIPVEDTLSVREVTNGFDSVNDGLRTVTRRAADYDAFQYNIQATANTGRNNKIVYPTGNTFTRTINPSSTINKRVTTFGAQSGTGGAFGQPGNPPYVANTSYKWIDESARVDKASEDSKSYMSGVTDGTGNFYLAYGTTANRSRAEFHDQIGRGAHVLIDQSDNLGTLSESGFTSGVGRKINEYYTINKPTYKATYADGTEIGPASEFDGNNASITNDVEGFILKNNAIERADFNFATTADAETAVDATVIFTNTIKVNSLNITKKVNNLQDGTQDDEFSFQIVLEDIFGISDVDMPENSYGSIVIKRSDSTDTETLDSDGAFKIKANQTVTIEGIPVGTKYEIIELNDDGEHITKDTEFSIGSNTYKNSGAVSQVGNISKNVGTVTTIEFTNEFVKGAVQVFNGDLAINKVWANVADDTKDNIPQVGIYLTIQRTTDKNADAELVNGWDDVAKIRLLKKDDSFIAEIVSETEYAIEDLSATPTDSAGDTPAKITWSFTIKNVAKNSGESMYRYRVIENSEYNLPIYVNENKGKYNDNYTVSYTAPVTWANTEDNQVKTLTVTNTYSVNNGTSVDMPKTGAQGVYAIVTFGALAITVAGIALLIYRKKLQTVNINAVKGSVKK